MQKPFRLFILATPLLLGSAGCAADGIDGLMTPQVVWRCWYDQQIHVTCLVDASPATDVPLDQIPFSSLPPAVNTVRYAPGSLRGNLVHIPLHTPPFDMEFTADLARITVCGRRPGCLVDFSSTLPPADEIIALLNKYLPVESEPPLAEAAP